MSNTSLAVRGITEYSVEITPAAIAARQQLLQSAAMVSTVTDTDEQTVAIEVASQLRRWNKELELAREEVKRPILDAGNLIQKIAKDAIKETDTEIKRIEGLVTAYQREQARIQQAAKDEQARLEREAQEQAQKAAKAEADRIAALQAEKDRLQAIAAGARKKADREAAFTKAAALADEIQVAEFGLEFAVAPEAPIVLIPGNQKPEGASVKKEITVEVHDLLALYHSHPHLVELTPRLADIKFHLRTLRDSGRPMTLPGVKVTEDIKVTGRAA